MGTENKNGNEFWNRLNFWVCAALGIAAEILL